MLTSKIAQTADERRLCFQLRAKEYRRYYHNVPVDEFRDEFDDFTLPDGSPQARSVLTQIDEEVVGTMRLIVVRDPRFPGLPSEITTFMDVDFEKWRVDALKGATPTAAPIVAEIGKLAVARDVDAKLVLGTTLAGLGQIALRSGVSILLAAMVPAVERKLRRVGARFRRMGDARLRRDARHELHYLLKYHQYFLPMLKRRAIDIDASQLTESEVSCEVLQALISDCVDGPSLYWMTTEEFVEGTRNYCLPLAADAQLV